MNTHSNDRMVDLIENKLSTSSKISYETARVKSQRGASGSIASY